MIKFKLLNADAKMPMRQTKESAGFDLHCTHDVIIQAGNRALVSTGVQVIIPPGYEGVIRGRSSVALKHGTVVVEPVDAETIQKMTFEGTIDSDYPGELKVLLFCLSGTFMAEKGDRIAQIVFHPVLTSSYAGDIFGESIRGDGGFGSTGK